MSKKAATKEEKRHMSRVADLGCIVCRNEGLGETPAGIHHLRNGQGMGQRSSHYETIPLCDKHHQNGPTGVAFHAGPRTWEKRYGTERELLEQVRFELGELHS